MSNTMNRTRDQIEAHLKRVQSSRVAKLVRRIMDEFLTVGAFLDATKGNLMAVYRKVHPEAKYELGRMFYMAYDEVRRYCNEPEPTAPVPLQQLAQPPAAEPAKPAPAPALVFSLPQMKALCSVMDLCSISHVDVAKMALFLNACDAKIPEL